MVALASALTLTAGLAGTPGAAAPGDDKRTDPAPRGGLAERRTAEGERAAGELAPVLGRRAASAIPGHYIVVMDDTATGSDRAAAQRSARSRGASVAHEYTAALSGFAAELTPQAVEALRRNPRVAYLQVDGEVRAAATQTNPPWGLDRIDQRPRALNATYRYDGTGSGVTAYVVDTGIRRSHRQFAGRVLAGVNTVPDGRGTGDCNGHGTHVAGTIGANRYGVAKGVTMRPVRVLDCTGTGSDSTLIAGVDWITGHHAAGTPAVANLSLGGWPSEAVDLAVATSIADGVTYVIAAGNETDDACNYSPQWVWEALTVGSTTKTDARSGFSNYGPCVDLFAPGSSILSTWHTGDTATKTISGTSMAAPHVAGAAALVLQQHPTLSPYLVGESLLKDATTGVVTGRGGGSPDRLLFSRAAAIVPTPMTGNLLSNGGFEQGDADWVVSPDVITSAPGAPAYDGSWKAWMLGYGREWNEYLHQTLTLPPGEATLAFQLMIASQEFPDGVYDELRLDVESNGQLTTLAQWSNLDAGESYVRRTVDLSPYAGQQIVLRWAAHEDSSVPTNFVLDDVLVTTG